MGLGEAKLGARVKIAGRLGPDENHIVLMSVRDGKLTVRDFYGDNYDIVMTPVSSNRFLVPGATVEFSPADAGRPQSWHVIDGEGRRLLELPLMKFEVQKAALPSFAVRDARGAIAGFTLNRNSARGVRFERVKRAG